MTLIIGSLILGFVLGIAYFVWDYNVQANKNQSEIYKAQYECQTETERTRQQWIKAVEQWDGKVLIVPEKLVTGR